MTQKKKARQERAAVRLQSSFSTLLPRSWSAEQIETYLNSKRQEFEAHCRSHTISLSNIEAAAVNTLSGAAHLLSKEEYERWRWLFVAGGECASMKGSKP